MRYLDLAPAVVILIGVLISALGAVWAAVKQNSAEQQLRAKSDEIAELNRQIAGSVTGGESFECLTFTPSGHSDRVAILFVHQGKYPLYDVVARVADLAKWDALPKGEASVTLGSFLAGDPRLQIGNVAPSLASILGEWPIPTN